MRDLLRIGSWWVRDYLYALVWQVRAAVDRTDPSSFRRGDLTPIVMLPGVYETWRFLQPLIAAVHGRGHPVHVLPVLRRNLRPVDEAAQEVIRYLDDNDLRGCVILAHSKGGLVGKRAMLLDAGAGRIERMLAVATPFGGSRYGRLMVVPSLRAFSPGNSTIRALTAEVEVNARIVSVYGRFDPHIPEGSELAGAARNVQLDTGGHFRILADPRVIGELAALAE
ncbi:alpha/beta hydrolase [Microbacterium sp. EYE_5]|uniref:esterase/lipase family protein n=1 Tax=unclassified Microbacterium TaxID=2609290 RepID=UPI0020042385|nr:MULTISPECIES: alpha/beta hydrolase [unclassified Microbacterium]MCK6079964.1 alpha/beta hydrolase [Microbacterium sp. EYE_382]MCK6085235.1 alpha/beta hydrolase [Microbacterium sp. EYE_384]MCK6122540.1 alpha/beta hydrolase [Microbacterium sp. EYE_80]MCK6125998.1 alpha/beta hydrolase [Microbacterium sp. EYE_79]MCK6140919.1 alpha/beta hydrolase [Microbacterium sp. EYE_39]